MRLPQADGTLFVLPVGRDDALMPSLLTLSDVIRALARDPRKARQLFPDAQVVVGDLTRPETLTAAVDGVNAIVFTHGSDGGKTGAERVDYGGSGDRCPPH